jgi:hypothetical protein
MTRAEALADVALYPEGEQPDEAWVDSLFHDIYARPHNQYYDGDAWQMCIIALRESQDGVE